MLPAFTRRLSFVGLAIALAMLVLPDKWPGVPEEIDIGPWDLPGPVVVAVLALLLLALIDWALAGRGSAIEISREMPAALALDVPGEITWQLQNLSRMRRVVSFGDELAPSLRADSRRARVALPARGHATVTTGIIPARRGEFAINEIAIRMEGPLGLAARQTTRTVPATLRVLPPFRSRREAELRISQRRVLEAGLRSAKGLGSGTEFDQLREYGPDDEFRRIDWAATARSMRPIVRTFRTEKNQRIVCLLDNGRVMAGRVSDVPRVEHAMDAVLMMTAVATGLGDKCGLVAFDREVRTVVAPTNRRDQLHRVSDALYDLEPVLAESNYRQAFGTTVARFRRRAMLVVLTDLVVQAVEASLLPALPLIARSHLVLVGAVRDPEVVAWSQANPTDAEEAHRKAAALDALADRDRAIAKLQALGAVVVDAAPGELAPRLADTYMGFKASGRL